MYSPYPLNDTINLRQFKLCIRSYNLLCTMEGVLYQGDGTHSCITHTRAQSNWLVMREPNRLTYIANRQCRKISQHMRFSQKIKQVAGASFGGLLLICLLKFTLNKKLLAHSLQFGSKYHISSDSLWAQITEHTEYNYMTAALYYVGEELENLMRTDKQRTDRQTDGEFNYRG